MRPSSPPLGRTPADLATFFTGIDGPTDSGLGAAVNLMPK